MATGTQEKPRRVDPELVRLVRGKGSKDRGGDEGGRYWHIYCGEQRAGHVYINVYDAEQGARRAYINIQVNADSQNRGIGSVAYRLAVEESGYDEVYAQMRKSNAMSRKAASHAGFTVLDRPGERQLLMRWTR